MDGGFNRITSFGVILLFLPLAFCDTTTPNQIHQIYLDVKPANTSMHLEALRMVPLSTYRLSYERSKANRVRVGMIGPELATIIPDAVEIIPKRVLPPMEKGGKPVTLTNVPVVNDQTLFMYGIGATQELGNLFEDIETELLDQVDRIAALFGEIAKLEHLLEESSDGGAEVRMRAATAEAKLAKAQMELEIQRAKDDEEYANAMKEAEMEQIARGEELTISRLARDDNMARMRAEESMKRKLEASQIVERARSDSAEAMSKLEHERALEIQRVKEKMKEQTEKEIAKAKAEAERANEDVHLRRLKAESEQRRQRNIAAIQTIFDNFSSMIFSATKNPKQVFVFVGYIALFAVGIYTAREAARLCRIIVESALGKPKLVRETTRKSFLHSLLISFLEKITLKNFYQGMKGRNQIEKRCEKEFEDLILSKSLKSRVLALAASASKARQNDAPHRHILLYGPPGTGKTMIARKLAKCVGMDYALMSGGDVGPLGSDAVTQIHALFSWAKFSRKGVLLFIDEAEAFLGNRNQSTMSENAHNALNALLYNTGGDRRDFMLVLASNLAKDLDAAVLDRCDESLFIPLPDASCRSKLISLYFDFYVRRTAEENNKKTRSLVSRMKRFFTKQPAFLIEIDRKFMTGDQLGKTVGDTEGFSGREIGKLMIAMQSALYTSDHDKFTKEDALSVVEMKVKEHIDKQRMMRSN